MHETLFLKQTVLIFGSALLVAWLFRVLRAPAIIGFLFTGLLIGPSGVGLIPADDVTQFAEIGLLLLLFTVGLELTPETLFRSGPQIVIASLIQMFATVGVMAVVVKLGYSATTIAAILVGIAIALSSTAIVLKQLADLRQTDSPSGSIITAILLVQDIFIIMVMMTKPMFAAASTASLGAVVGRGLLAITGLIVTTLIIRRVLSPLLRWLVGQGARELVTLLAVFMACAGAYLAELVGWSGALGACIAGLLLAETDLRHQLFADILPFRDVFNALFFISMGMLVDLPAVAPHLPFIAGAIVGVILAKTAIAAFAVRIAGWPTRLAIQVGLGLCTISEFSYIVAREAAELEIISQNWVKVLLAVTVGTMLLGATLVPISDRIASALSRSRKTEKPSPASSSAEETLHHVIIVGFGLNGHNLATVLRETRVPFCVIEMNRYLADRARVEGCRVIVGDAAQSTILEHAGLHDARALVIAIDDQHATRRIVAQAHHARSDLFILARTRYLSELDTLYKLGARMVIPEEFETSIEIFAHVLKEFGIPDNIIENQILMVRSGRYGMLRGSPTTARQRSEILQMLDATATQTFLIPTDSPAHDRSMKDLDLRAKSGATVIAIVRSGKPVTNPSPDTHMQAGDVLVLVGSHEQLDKAKTLLSKST
ncbi:MAG: cation:proton antiporter [Planctomycetes bacterium]|nr:cation:proton antiporter [Planctomycetota bacterium]